ncbi:hypothetical protein DIPPA_32721 [Diplonema papillatum]|nr:hypothetical protein DIPPA_32721 [Diplonema papillatum]
MGFFGCSGGGEWTQEKAREARQQSRLCQFIGAFVKKHKDLEQHRDPYEKYKTLRKLGQGAYGVVYRVEERATGKRYALKEVAKPGTERTLTNCMQWKSLLTEIEVLSELDHDGCVRLHELMDTPTHIYMVQELVKGTSLQMYATMNPLSERDAAEIAAHVLTALQYLHEVKHIVHRDIKPENILIALKDTPVEDPIFVRESPTQCPISGEIDGAKPLGSNGDRFTVKLVDFGSSRFISSGLLGGRYGGDGSEFGNESVNMPAATPVGSALFLSLEIINIALDNSTALSPERMEQLPKVDIYSLGVLVFLLLCRQHPFLVNTMDGLKSMRDKMVDDAGNTKLVFPPESEMEHPLSKQAMDFVENCLAHSPEDRMSASRALRHPWIVCRHYRCESQRGKPISAWDVSNFTAPEENEDAPAAKRVAYVA